MGDLKELSKEDLLKHFGKVGRISYGIVRSVDDRRVEPNRETKSIGAEDTFLEDLTALEEMHEELNKIALLVADRLKRRGLRGRTVTLKIKYHDFILNTRSRSLAVPVNDLETVTATAKALIAEAFLEGAKIRLLGITLSNFGENPVAGSAPPQRQLPLFS